MALRDSVLKLNDKTVAITGSFGSMVQMIMTVLTEQGADVAYVGKESAEARRFSESINDQREVYSHYGRATAVGIGVHTETDANEAIMRTVESFNRLDCLLDASLCGQAENTSGRHMIAAASKFLLGRPKGRILLLWHTDELAKPVNHIANTSVCLELQDVASQIVRENPTKLITANAIQLGITEEYLLNRFPKSASIKAALEEMRAENPLHRLVEPLDIANLVAFMISPLSQALNFQVLTLDHGHQKLV